MKQPVLRTTLGLIAVLACSARDTITMAGPRAENASTLEAPAGVIGEVVGITNNHPSYVVLVKTESGATVSIVVDEATEVKRVTSGEWSIENVAGISAADIATGDRVYARGAHPDVSGTARARQLIVMPSIEVQQKREREGRA